MADVTTDASVAIGSKLSGKLYLSNGRLRVDWGEFADVFDLTKRTGWRVIASSKMFETSLTRTCPRMHHVYFWTDDTLPITVRCDIGETRYEVKNLRKATFSDALFELPTGYQRVDRSHIP